MSDQQITRLYRWFSIATLVVGIAFTLIPFKYEFLDRLWIAFILNLGFQLAYHFLSKAPVGMVRQIRKDNPVMGNLVGRFFMLWTILLPVASILATIQIIITSISDNQYEKLLTLLWFVSITLASIKLRIKLKLI